MSILLQGDCLDVLKTLPSESVQCVVTSPPYYGLRDYGTAKWEGGDRECDHNPGRADGGERADRTLPLGRGGMYKDVCGMCGAKRIDNQIGLEKSPEDYVANLVNIFREVRRVLRKDGTVWLVLGDSYWANRSKNGQSYDDNEVQRKRAGGRGVPGLKPKDLIGIPWMVSFALRTDGWYLRSDIIWYKTNPMPESVKDRPTNSHEHIFLLTKRQHYYYDYNAIKEPAKYPNDDRKGGAKETHKSMPDGLRNGLRPGNYTYDLTKRNKRTVWEISTRPYKGAHFATYPPALIEPCILAGSKEGDVILDPFCGSGTTGEVSLRYNRAFIGIELNPEYIELAKKRLDKVQIRMAL